MPAMTPSMENEIKGTKVALDGYYWLVVTADGTRDDAYTARDSDYDLPDGMLPDRLISWLESDGWPVPFTRMPDGSL